MLLRNDEKKMKKENLSTKLLRLMRCQNSESRQCCSIDQCCCAWCCWKTQRPKKPDIQFVLAQTEAEGEPQGYDNEACNDKTTKDLVSDLYHKIEIRRHNSVSLTPVISLRPIQFWTSTTQNIQPREMRCPSPTTLVPSPVRPTSVCNLQPHLYECSSSPKDDHPHDLTDNEKLERFGLGQLHLALQYELATWTLVIRVIEARELPRPGRTRVAEEKPDLPHSNPYVKVCLLPDQKNARQTSVKRKTQNPHFEESFSFEMSFHEAQRRTLHAKVMDFDKYSRHCTIGEITLPLSTINLVKGIHLWKTLCPCEKELAELGEVLLSLNYLPSAGRLNVDVIKAKQLLQTDMQGASAPYVNLTLVHDDKTIKSKRTSVKRNTNDPVFSESFSFRLGYNDLREMSLVVTVWDSRAGLSKDAFIGRAVLGKKSSGPNQMTHWQRMLKSQRSAVAQWHSLQTRQECDEVSSASRIIP